MHQAGPNKTQTRTLLPLSRRENELHLQRVQLTETYFHFFFRPLSHNNKISILYTLFNADQFKLKGSVHVLHSANA